MLSDILREPIERADNVISEINKFASKGAEAWESFGDQFDKFGKSWFYDTREPVSGEVKGLHPNMFLGLTGLRFIGVTRLPVLGARVIKGSVPVGKRLWNAGRHTKSNLKSLSSGVSTLKGKVRNPLPKTTAQLKKSPKVAGIITGTVIATIVTTGLDNAMNGASKKQNDELDTFLKRKKVSRARWV